VVNLKKLFWLSDCNWNSCFSATTQDQDYFDKFDHLEEVLEELYHIMFRDANTLHTKKSIRYLLNREENEERWSRVEPMIPVDRDQP
jgi:hypothetical protein